MLKQINDAENEILLEKNNKKDWFDLDCSLATTKKNKKAYKLMIQKHYT